MAEHVFVVATEPNTQVNVDGLLGVVSAAKVKIGNSDFIGLCTNHVFQVTGMGVK